MRQKTHRAVIIGGGITGLSAAYHLHELLGGSTSIALLDSSSRLGGQIRTEKKEDYLLEGGPDTLLSHKPGGISLCEQLGMKDEIIRVGSSGRETQILHRGRLVSLPEGFMMMAPTRIWPTLASPLFSLTGKLRMGLERFLPPKPESREDESLSSFVTRRFGREVLERVAEPIIAGLFIADADNMSLKTHMPRFLEMEREHGSVTRAVARRMRDSGRRGDHGYFAYLKGGLGRITEELLARLPGDCVRTGVRIDRIARNPATGGWSIQIQGGRTLESDTVVFACPAHATASWVGELDGCLKRELERISYASCATISLVYPKADVSRPRNSFGFFVPRSERTPLLACSFVDAKFREWVPENRVLLRVFVGGAPGVLDQDDLTLAGKMHEELGKILRIRREPVFHKVYRFPRSMPRYEVGYPARRESILRRIHEHPGLFLAGSAVGAVGLPDCILSGRQAAHAAASHLGDRVENRDLVESPPRGARTPTSMVGTGA